MPIEKVPNSSLNYYLIAFDKDGNERDEADGKKLSEQIFSALANEAITDVFLPASTTDDLPLPEVPITAKKLSFASSFCKSLISSSRPKKNLWYFSSPKEDSPGNGHSALYSGGCLPKAA